MARDIVQFVPFRDFKNQPLAALARETLAEIPTQVIERRGGRRERGEEEGEKSEVSEKDGRNG